MGRDRHLIVDSDREAIEEMLLDLESSCMNEEFEDSGEGYCKAMRRFWRLAFKIENARLLPWSENEILFKVLSKNLFENVIINALLAHPKDNFLIVKYFQENTNERLNTFAQSLGCSFQK